MAKRTLQASQRRVKRPSDDGSGREKILSEDLPRRTLEESLDVPRTLHGTFAGKAATWEEIAETLNVSSSNPNNKYPLWAAVAYGLVTKEQDGRYSLSEKGRKVVAPNFEGEDHEATTQAVQTPTILGRFYADYNGSPVPAEEHLLNVLENRYGVPRSRRKEAADLILDNARFAGILREQADGRRTIHLDAAPEPLSGERKGDSSPDANDEAAIENGAIDYSKVCFMITPIGSEGDEERRHADMVLKHLVTPVAREAGMEVVRADKIGKPGLITQQIVEYIARSRICIADLSFGNPNAFYEIGVRHTFKLPTIQIIRRGDKIPFDVSQGRTIIVDTSDVYTIMDKFESARKELKEHLASSLNGGADARDNPISYYLPGLQVKLSA